MPRKGRLHIPGGCYHVIGRGLERRYIFKHAEDKEEFLARLGENLSRSGAQCLAWAMMSNHYHLLIRVDTKPLSKLMAPVLSGYAGYYNRRYRRAGYVFQNRFQSILCDIESYLLALIRYIHLNPVRAGMLEDLGALDRYRWTGHAGILGRHSRPWHEIDEVLSLFGATRRKGRIGYGDFIGKTDMGDPTNSLSGGGLVRSYGGWEAVSRFRKEHITCIGDERILGGSEFIENALAQDELQLDYRSRLERAGWDMSKLISEVCTLSAIEKDDLNKKARNNALSTAKALICYWGVNKLGFTAREIASELNITQPAVSYWTVKGKRYCDIERIKIEQLMS